MKNQEYDNLMQQLKKQVKQKDKTNLKLQKRINNLIKEVSDLHAAADDMEKEVAEAIKKEEQLLLDAEKWRRLARDNGDYAQKVDDDNKILREELSRYKGETAIFKAALKAVL